MIKALAHAQDLERTADRDAPIDGSDELLTDLRIAVRELAEKVRLAQNHAPRRQRRIIEQTTDNRR